MKKIYLLLFFSVFIAGESLAQYNLDMLIGKFRRDGFLRKHIIHQPKEHKPYSITTSIFFLENNSVQVDEALQAFEKDQKDAMTVTERTSQSGFLECKTLVFETEGIREVYTLECTDESNAEMTYSKSDFQNKERQGSPSSAKRKNDPSKRIYAIPENGYMYINGEKVNIEQARAMGYDVRALPAE